MSRVDRSGFDWKEIAEMLHMPRGMALATFWREMKRSRSKKIGARVIVIQEERDPDTQKVRKPRASR